MCVDLIIFMTSPPGHSSLLLVLVATCPLCLDVVFVVDNSASVGDRFHIFYKKFIKAFSFADPWDIGKGDRNYQVRVTIR